MTRYDTLLIIGPIIDNIVVTLGGDVSQVSIFNTLGLRFPKKQKNSRGSKQHLEECRVFGHALYNLSLQLSYEAITGQLPLNIKLGDHELELYPARTREFDKLGYSSRPNRKILEKKISRHLLAPSVRMSDDRRCSIVNKRIHIDMLMFVIATGATKSVMQRLVIANYKCVPVSPEEVAFTFQEYKGRARRNVTLTVYKEYKPVLERYVSFRNKVFSDDFNSKWLFPSLTLSGLVTETPHTMHRGPLIDGFLNILKIQYIGPRALRKTRVNWIARQSADPQLTAQEAQHTVETLHRSYLEPNHQKAVSETALFWTVFDPTKLSVSGGQCIGEQLPISVLENTIVEPDCVTPSGCLFCENHRDVMTQDYVWLLVTFRFLKHVEAASLPSDEKGHELYPSDKVINRLTEKIELFRKRKEPWVIKALTRVEEGDYHHQWVDALDLILGFSDGF